MQFSNLFSGHAQLPGNAGCCWLTWKKPAFTLSCGWILPQLLFQLLQQRLQCCGQTGGGVALEGAQQAKERLLAEEALHHSAHQRLQRAAAGIRVLAAATHNLVAQQQRRVTCVRACVYAAAAQLQHSRADKDVLSHTNKRIFQADDQFVSKTQTVKYWWFTLKQK